MIQRISYDVNTKTGETFNNRVKTFNVFSDKGFLFRAKNHFRKSFADIKLSTIVTDGNDYRRVHLLAENIYKDTNAIMIVVNTRKIRVADIEDISKIIGLNIRNTNDFLIRMIKLHVIAKRTDTVGDTTTTKYYLNPLFFCSSKYLSSDLYFLFQESLDCYLSKYVIKMFHDMNNIKKLNDNKR